MELRNIVGVGEKWISDFGKLGIYNVLDFITYYPKRYVVIRRSDINKASDILFNHYSNFTHN